MWRLMVVTFGFLGWSFYELSGGGDYQPADGSRQAAAALGAQNAVQTAAVPTSEKRPMVRPVTLASAGGSGAGAADAQVVLASADPGAPIITQSPSGEKRIRLTLTQNDEAAVVAAPAPAPAMNGVTTVAANAEKIAQLVRPSGARPKTTNAALSGTDSDADGNGADIRKVKGTRVNMRAGPSTDYGVVARLTRGTRVEILRDQGDGWVELRVLDTDEIGFMADFLLVASN